ncbi:MAG: hypothetical protein AAGA00_11250, partial [Pseudomonadota bacterium]
LAQEAGRAASTLEALRLPGAACLLDVLNATDGVPCEDLRPGSTQAPCWQAENPMCPLLVGAFISDLGALSQEVKLRRVHSPLLLVPFCLMAFENVVFNWSDCTIRTSDEGLHVQGEIKTALADKVSIEDSAPARQASHCWQPGAVDIADEIWEALSAFAHRTYVPASEASRLKGAGAGLTDND